MRFRQPARAVGDVDDGVRRERQRQDRQRLPRIAHQGTGGDDQEADREGDVETDAARLLGGDREADVGAGDQRQQQRAELRQPQLGDQAVRRDAGIARGPHRLPGRTRRPRPATATATVRRPSLMRVRSSR